MPGLRELNKVTVKKPRGSLQVNAQMEWLKVEDLIFDSRYNRVPREVRINKIVSEFDPNLFGVLLISHRYNDSNAIIDGQHRTRAMLEMGEQETLVPCFTYYNLSLEGEANLFRRFNQERTAPNATDIFRAKLAEKDQQTLNIQKVLSRYGLSVSLQPNANTVRSVNALTLLYVGGGDNLLDLTLSIVKAAWPNDYAALDGKLLEGLGIMSMIYPGQINMEQLVGKLQNVTPNYVLTKARQIREALGGGLMGIHVARTMVAMYNSKRQSGKLSEVKIPKGGKHPLSQAAQISRGKSR